MSTQSLDNDKPASHLRRSHPAQFGVDRFGPPTLERSGSEHRRAVTSLIPMVGI